MLWAAEFWGMIGSFNSFANKQKEEMFQFPRKEIEK